MIYHVVTEINWQYALENGFYEAESLAKEGFIHASRQNQVAGVLERYYKGQNDLMLLHINEKKLTAPLKYELAPSVNEEFPHIYGRLNIDAVAKAEKI
ncbi:MAG: DUF952 domain-containing protein [Ferruginibacter sp.]|nr:DUF952 domain-containing protein [Ferruginibacter sp.]